MMEAVVASFLLFSVLLRRNSSVRGWVGQSALPIFFSSLFRHPPHTVRWPPTDTNEDEDLKMDTCLDIHTVLYLSDRDNQ